MCTIKLCSMLQTMCPEFMYTEDELILLATRGSYLNTKIVNNTVFWYWIVCIYPLRSISAYNQSSIWGKRADVSLLFCKNFLGCMLQKQNSSQAGTNTLQALQQVSPYYIFPDAVSHETFATVFKILFMFWEKLVGLDCALSRISHERANWSGILAFQTQPVFIFLHLLPHGFALLVLCLSVLFSNLLRFMIP